MKKTVIGGMVGGIIIFVWSFLAFVLLPFHEPTFHQVTKEDEAIQALKSLLDQQAVYMLPKNPGMSADKAAMDAWEGKVKRGPIAMIVYNPGGVDPMMPRQMIIGLILDILAAWVVCWFLARSVALNAPYISRVAYCGMFGLFVSLFTHLMSWNWLGFPVDYTSAMIIDAILSWIFAGLGIAAIVKAPKLTTT